MDNIISAQDGQKPLNRLPGAARAPSEMYSPRMRPAGFSAFHLRRWHSLRIDRGNYVEIVAMNGYWWLVSVEQDAGAIYVYAAPSDDSARLVSKSRTAWCAECAQLNTIANRKIRRHGANPDCMGSGNSAWSVRLLSRIALSRSVQSNANWYV